MRPIQNNKSCHEKYVPHVFRCAQLVKKKHTAYMSPDPGSQPPPPMVWSPTPPPYLIHFAHATVTKLTFPYFCMHAAVARCTFSFCWMNPLAGFGGSIARNCGEMQILSSRSCSAQCTGRFNAQHMESYTYIHIQVHIHIHTYTYIYIHIHKNR